MNIFNVERRYRVRRIYDSYFPHFKEGRSLFLPLQKWKRFYEREADWQKWERPQEVQVERKTWVDVVLFLEETHNKWLETQAREAADKARIKAEKEARKHSEEYYAWRPKDVD